MDTLSQLSQLIRARKKADPKQSYTAQLLQGSRGRATRKFGEEAVELVIASMEGSKEDIAEEAADVIYHLMVLMAHHDMSWESVCEVLEKRQHLSGLEEKAAREIKK